VLGVGEMSNLPNDLIGKSSEQNMTNLTEIKLIMIRSR
jgi:hypothetical protein